MQAGAFSLEPHVIAYRNRIGGITSRQRARFKPLSPVGEDVRVFLLQAAPQAAQLQAVSVKKMDCGGMPCFDVVMNGQARRLTFAYANTQYSLVNIQPVATAFEIRMG
ncbi:hypothetical protein [Thiothrix fructosivorans]|uniref:Uncharacterized protein n=1 Tax=Thiothrix fructosivorans TaxID=111770 RepID=A0ABS3ITY9_9GAMM|nr:hypothetical protein [Thiothrix fructosivorans]MBO0615422.1 hypothetical protein [Thiothrix fructosivorans]